MTEIDWTLIDELKRRHPVESCDLFRTTTGGCTCTPPEMPAGDDPGDTPND